MMTLYRGPVGLESRYMLQTISLGPPDTQSAAPLKSCGRLGWMSSALSHELPDSESVAGELLTVLGLSEELSELVGARVDVVSPRTLHDDVRAAAISEAIPL